MKHTESWYDRRLRAYFGKVYGSFEDEVEFFPNPSPNQWLFVIPRNGVKVELTCDDDGLVTERHNYITNQLN